MVLVHRRRNRNKQYREDSNHRRLRHADPKCPIHEQSQNAIFGNVRGLSNHMMPEQDLLGCWIAQYMFQERHDKPGSLTVGESTG